MKIEKINGIVSNTATTAGVRNDKDRIEHKNIKNEAPLGIDQLRLHEIASRTALHDGVVDAITAREIVEALQEGNKLLKYLSPVLRELINSFIAEYLMHDPVLSARINELLNALKR